MKIITHFFKKNAPVIFSFCLLLLMLGLSYDLYARAGGGGGGGGGGDDGGLVGLIIYILIYLLPFPYNLIAIAILVLLVIIGRKKMRQKSYFSKLPIETGTADQNAKGYNSFATANPDFKLDEFKKKVETAFTKVQDAWSKQDLGPVRRFMSDGVYQRFNTQFIMMKLLDQKDIVEGLKVLSVSCSKFYSDGNFDVIDVAIQANIKDKFISEKYPNLNQSYLEEFVEYWSFIRKKNATKTDMFDTDNCPKCGAALPKNAGDMSKCEYCGTFTNLGDYDWVLSEITQADDYAFGNPKLSKQ
ncbi:MAG: Tim44-like domain-containing protein, partial [Bacteroidota bacterium]